MPSIAIGARHVVVNLAEEEGFEPPDGCPSTDFKSGAAVPNGDKPCDSARANSPNDPVRDGGSVSEPPGSVSAGSRAALIAVLYEHAAALARVGDLEAAKLAHDTAGQLLAGLAPSDAAEIIDLNKRRGDT